MSIILLPLAVLNQNIRKFHRYAFRCGYSVVKNVNFANFTVLRFKNILTNPRECYIIQHVNFA